MGKEPDDEQTTDAGKALEELYSFLDRNGAVKRSAYLIERLIDAKISEAMEQLRNDIQDATGIRP